MNKKNYYESTIVFSLAGTFLGYVLTKSIYGALIGGLLGMILSRFSK